MLEFLKDLLEDLKDLDYDEREYFINYYQKVFSLETAIEILEKIKSSKSELLDLRMQNARGALEKPVKINTLKKDIERMMTILKEREQNPEGGNK